MRNRRPHIPQRLPIFVGCEGDSEAGYARLLDRLAREQNLPIHLHIQTLAPGAGDPLARVELAVGILDRLRARRTPFRHRFVLLDDDQLAQAPQRAQQARRLAADNEIEIIWQSPCHEAVLLRHINGRAGNRPPTSQVAHQALSREWADYRKPLDGARLAQLLDLEAVLRAAAVEPQLALLLRAMGLMP